MNYLLKQNASFLPPFYCYSFDKDSLRCLSKLLYDSYSTVTIWGDRIGSEKSKLERCKYVMAIAKTTNDTHPGIVKYFFHQKIKIKWEGSFMLLQWRMSSGINHIHTVIPPIIRSKSLCLTCLNRLAHPHLSH